MTAGIRPFEKVFCIGANKTGTTTLERLLQELGLNVAPQSPAEQMLEDWARRDFARIIEFCRHYEAFQDIPFSLPDTYRHLDAAYPGSKFILSVRGSADEWFDSLLRFEQRFFGRQSLPTADDMRSETYCYTGWYWQSHQFIWGATESTLYDADLYKAQYNQHNEDVIHHFHRRLNDLLVVNVADPSALVRICQFLSLDSRAVEMPHLNRSR